MFNGNCREAFDFYARVLGGTIEFSQTFGEAPPGHSTEETRDLIMHISMDIDGTKLFGSDAPAEHAVTFGNNFSIALNPDSEADSDRLFNAISDGGQVTMPLMETFWAKKFGMCTDKFGVNWMISYAEVKEPA